MLVNLLRSFLRRKYEMRGGKRKGRGKGGIGHRGAQDCFAKVGVRGNEDKIQTARKEGKKKGKEGRGTRVAVLIRF